MLRLVSHVRAFCCRPSAPLRIVPCAARVLLPGSLAGLAVIASPRNGLRLQAVRAAAKICHSDAGKKIGLAGAARSATDDLAERLAIAIATTAPPSSCCKWRTISRESLGVSGNTTGARPGRHDGWTRIPALDCNIR